MPFWQHFLVPDWAIRPDRAKTPLAPQEFTG
jgi:hypothetical protein